MIITDRAQLEIKCRETNVQECKDLNLFDKLALALMNSKQPGSGLAAIQVGIGLRASLMVTDKKVYRMVNPVILSQEEPIVFTGEGCLSEPGRHHNTDRYNKVRVEYIDYDDGIKKLIDAEGYNAVVLQHEIDHMDGILNYMRAHVSPVKIGRNEPCDKCLREGITIKWKKCKKHNNRA